MEITSKTLYLKNINLTFQKKKIGKKNKNNFRKNISFYIKKKYKTDKFPFYGNPNVYIRNQKH